MLTVNGENKGHFDSGFDPDAPVVVLLTGLVPRSHSEENKVAIILVWRCIVASGV